MSLTGNELLTAFGDFLDDSWVSTTTSAGSTTTLVDTALQRFRERANVESFVRIMTESATAGNLYDIRRISGFTGATLTVSPAFAQSVASGTSYEIRRYDPAKMFKALDRARILAFPQVARIVVDETLTSDGESTEIDIPASIRRGPAFVYAETPLTPSVSWNLLTNGALTSTTGWTASTLTAATYTRTDTDRLIPKLEDTCLKLTNASTTGYLQQALSSTLAAAMAGRKMAFGVWVFSLTAGAFLRIYDDNGFTESDTHLGGGWEFLQLTRNVYGTNATTLQARIYPMTSNATYVERAYFANMDRIPVTYDTLMIRKGSHRDSDDARVYLQAAASRGLQYRMVGRTPVSALGTDQTTQTTNIMEVDEEDQDLLLAAAARILLTWEGISSGEIEKVYPQITLAEARFKELQEDWKRRYPMSGSLQPGF